MSTTHCTQSRRKRQTSWLFAVCALLLSACETRGPLPPVPPVAPPVAPAPPAAPAPPVPGSLKAPPIADAGRLQKADWRELPGWHADDHLAAWEALQRSCEVLQRYDAWHRACSEALAGKPSDRDAARLFFERSFAPYQLQTLDAGASGLITGYYEPLLEGSREPSARYRYPLYAVPDDLLVVDFAAQRPEMKGMGLRGRLDGRRIIPYYDRAGVTRGDAAVRGKEIAWVEDPVELFFLQIQGSGRIRLEDGTLLHVGYAEHNGYPYRSIGRWLIDRGELTLEQASMEGIKAWARNNPTRLDELLNHNQRYVFFRVLPGDLPGPLGALGVPLTAGRSVAIDPRFVPLGAPVYLATTWPNSTRPLARLMLAQDTGSAIRGPVRADFFWGFGPRAARLAGSMKQPLRMWVLLPTDYPGISGNQRGTARS